LPDARATLETLPEIVEAAERVEVYLDGGVRRGGDVLKALALGARCVLIGRPIFWGLAIDGEAGLRSVLQILRAELDSAMSLCGVADVENVDRRLVAVPGAWTGPAVGAGGMPVTVR
jgi:isopentenyl diphosphate isomerase/L-lactate dehydrogenase-like FMN-dependent dehydrogenase